MGTCYAIHDQYIEVEPSLAVGSEEMPEMSRTTVENLSPGWSSTAPTVVSVLRFFAHTTGDCLQKTDAPESSLS
jgi:hypothetical protein